MTEKERLRKVYRHLINTGVASNQTDIGKKLGYSKSYLSSVGSKYPISDILLDKLVSLDNNLNKVWIATGKGDMLSQLNCENKVEERGSHHSRNVVSLSRNEYNEMKKQISDLISTNMNLSYINKELIDSNKNLSEHVNEKKSSDKHKIKQA